MSGLAVGLDLVAVARIQRMLDRKGDHALGRLLTPGERTYCLAQPVPARHVAARVAAKEAVYKALQGTEEARGIGWREIEVVRDAMGRPSVKLAGRALQRMAALGATTVHLSLSHTDGLAAAIVAIG